MCFLSWLVCICGRGEVGVLSVLPDHKLTFDILRSGPSLLSLLR